MFTALLVSGSWIERGTEGRAALVEDQLAAADRVVHTLVALQVSFDQLDVAEASRRFSRRPVAKLSRTRTSYPSRTSRSTTLEPMNPPPPVTRTLVPAVDTPQP
jgi:hypothetical protein